MPGVIAEIPVKQDVIIPNAHAILYQMFAGQGPVQVDVNDDNQAEVKELIDIYFKLGGYPLIDFKVSPDLLQHTEREFFTSIASLARKHSQQLSNGNYKTVLHQLVFHPAIPLSIVKSLIGKSSLLKEVLNTRDFEGKTPVLLAIQHGNFAFLDAISESRSIFIKDDQYLSQAIS